jgi:hypothetical protein
VRRSALPREVLVEDLADHRPRGLGVGKEVAELQHRRIVRIPQAAGTAKRRDAAFHADARAGKGGEVARAADQSGGLRAFLRCSLLRKQRGRWSQ